MYCLKDLTTQKHTSLITYWINRREWLCEAWKTTSDQLADGWLAFLTELRHVHQLSLSRRGLKLKGSTKKINSDKHTCWSMGEKKIPFLCQISEVSCTWGKFASQPNANEKEKICKHCLFRHVRVLWRKANMALLLLALYSTVLVYYLRQSDIFVTSLQSVRYC